MTTDPIIPLEDDLITGDYCCGDGFVICRCRLDLECNCGNGGLRPCNGCANCERDYEEEDA